MMIVHEVMGRDCGWLTAATAQAYRQQLSRRPLLPTIGLTKARLDVHAVFIPELPIDLEMEAARLKAILDANDNVNIFICKPRRDRRSRARCSLPPHGPNRHSSFTACPPPNRLLQRRARA